MEVGIINRLKEAVFLRIVGHTPAPDRLPPIYTASAPALIAAAMLSHDPAGARISILGFNSKSSPLRKKGCPTASETSPVICVSNAAQTKSGHGLQGM